MTNSKTTRRALFSSVVALLLCFTMLLGTTFAWFTDSASSAVNTIQAGTLDVELQKYTNGTWVNAQGQTIAFIPAQGNASDILWEPGCTFLTEQLHVVNNGDLALKFDLVVSGGTTSGGDGTVDLMDALEFTYDIYNDTDGKGGDGADVTVSNGTVKGQLLKGQTSGTIVIRVHMKEDAGNEYQGLKLENISVAVSAQQLSHEYDSFGNYYDEQIEALAGASIMSDTYGVRVAMEVLDLRGITGPDSFYINILDANGNVMNTVKPAQKTIDALTDANGVFQGATACAYLTNPTNDDWWVINSWGTLDANNAPAKAVLFVNGVEKGSCNITANGITWDEAVAAYNN